MASGDGLEAVRPSALADNSGADLFTYFTADTAYYGTIGIAWLPVVCTTSNNGWKTNINEWRNNMAANAYVSC